MVGFLVGVSILLFILIASTCITYAMTQQSNGKVSPSDAEV